MCGRFVVDIDPGLIKEIYGLASVPVIKPRFNIAPSQKVAAIREDSSGVRELVELRWGLVPHWAKEQSIGTKMINARSETAHEKPSFRNSFSHRRCIIPASGFYEWEKRGKEKIPHYIHLHTGGVMSFAGLWDLWTSPEGEMLETCTILTTTANDLLQTFHDRMPVILSEKTFVPWLDQKFADTNRLRECLMPTPSEMLEEHPVSTDVNSPQNDRRELIYGL